MKKIIFSIFIFFILIFSLTQLNIYKKNEIGENYKNAKSIKEKNMNFILNPGNERNYKLLREVNIEEMEIKLYEVEHIKTKCKIILALCDDENKAFTIGFKTFPYSDNGICHIMEHSILCGSRKYNVKDPFFSLNKTSLATFMNAMTGKDVTFYPIASANLQDYKNLMDVYLDAVFFPNLKENDKILAQEGWHYEIENVNSPLKITGVVYNEMKGDMSNPTSLLEYKRMKDMYPNTPYIYNYGGEPEEIISLTHEELVNFHDTYYHPSNAVIYLYGNVDMNERLEYIHKEYLSTFDYKEIKYPEINVNKDDIKDGEYYYPEDSGADNKAYISYNMVYKDDRDPVRLYVMKILNYLLFNKEGALISDKIIKEGLGESVSCSYGFAGDTAYVNIIAENINENKKDKFKDTVDILLNDINENGIDERALRSAINYAYINVAEPKSGWGTRGLMLYESLIDGYFYGYDMESNIAYKEAFDIIKNSDLSDKNNIFMKTFREMYIEPMYKNITLLSPKVGLQAENDQKETMRLAKIKDEFKAKKNGTNLDSIIKTYKELLTWMQEEDKEENVASLPSLSVENIDREINQVNYEKKEIYGKDLIYTDGNTGELTYIAVDFDMGDPKKLNETDKYYLALLSNLFGTLDTENYSYEDLNTELDLYTGGFSSGMVFSDEKCIYRFSMKVTKDKVVDAYRLMYEIIYNTKFDDTERIGQKIKEIKNYANEAIISEGHGSVLNRALSKYSFKSEMSDKTGMIGIAFNMFINDLSRDYKKKSERLVKALTNTKNKYFKYDILFLDCCTDNKNYESYAKASKIFLQDVASTKLPIDDEDYSGLINSDAYKRTYTMEVFLTDASVNFVARTAMIGEKRGKEDYDPSMQVLANILRYDYLHNKIRVEGGAYGSGIIMRRDGYTGCYSYRDPKLKATDNIYKDMHLYANSMKLTKKEVDENIIGAMQTIDTYTLPQEQHIKNLSYYFAGVTNEENNKERQAILDTTVEHMNELKTMFKDIWEDSEFCALANKSMEDDAKLNYKIVKKLNFD